MYVKTADLTIVVKPALSVIIINPAIPISLWGSHWGSFSINHSGVKIVPVEEYVWVDGWNGRL